MAKEQESGVVVAKPGLVEYIKAAYPCIFLPTVEPEVATRRVLAALEEVDTIKDVPVAKVQLGVWKVTTGLKVGYISSKELSPVGEDTMALIDAMAWVARQKNPAIVIFHNIREFIKLPAIIQQMVDTALVARTIGSCMFLVGAYLDVPPELRSLITFVDCPLPTVEQIQGEYDKIVTAYEEEIEGLPDSREERADLVRTAATAAVGLDSMGAESAFALSLATCNRINIPVIQAQKEQEVKKSDVLEFVRDLPTMDQVGGFAALKEWATKRKRSYTEEAKRYGLTFPKGVLIVGPAGTGKSWTAKALASFLGLACLRLDIPRIFRSYVGESEGVIRLVLQIAEAVAPVLLWIDEIDKGIAGGAGGGSTGGGGGDSTGVTQRVVSTLLTWRQETKAPVFLAATANEVTSLPSMVYRKGRFDEVWATDLPDLEERKEIFSIHIRKRRNEENGMDLKRFDLQALAKKSEEFTGAEIESCVEDAMISAFNEGKEVAMPFILQSIKETVPQEVRDREENKRIRDWCKTRARLVSGKDAEECQKIGFITEGKRALKLSKKGE